MEHNHSGQRSKRHWRSLTDSKNYQHGKFNNLLPTPTMAEGVSMRKLLYDYFFNRPGTVTPSHTLPSVKTDLTSLHSDTPVIVWFGHSSYLIHCRGINILVDPVFSGHASPFRNMVRAFRGADVYKEDDMPPIDFMIITHNHYDHLDKKTLQKLSPTTKTFYTSLGVGKDIAESCGDDTTITEMDWWETEKPAADIELTATPARHFSGRGLKRYGSLWSSFVLNLYGYKIFIGGDSGYGTHFSQIGEKYGPFDIALLECGQYNTSWPLIHMMPEETVQASIDLKAKMLMPIHWGKFTLANHPWNEPVTRAVQAAQDRHVAITTPLIGEPVIIGSNYPVKKWWDKV